MSLRFNRLSARPFKLIIMSDQEEEFDLDLLCDVAELEGYKDGKKEEVRIMNKAMDIRLKQIEK